MKKRQRKHIVDLLKSLERTKIENIARSIELKTTVSVPSLIKSICANDPRQGVEKSTAELKVLYIASRTKNEIPVTKNSWKGYLKALKQKNPSFSRYRVKPMTGQEYYKWIIDAITTENRTDDIPTTESEDSDTGGDIDMASPDERRYFIFDRYVDAKNCIDAVMDLILKIENGFKQLETISGDTSRLDKVKSIHTAIKAIENVRLAGCSYRKSGKNLLNGFKGKVVNLALS